MSIFRTLTSGLPNFKEALQFWAKVYNGYLSVHVKRKGRFLSRKLIVRAILIPCVVVVVE